MWFTLGCALVLCPAPQEPGPVLVETPGGVRILADDYRGWLHRMVGGARLEEMLFDRILELECAAIPDSARPADLTPALAAPQAAGRARIERRIATEHGGDRAAWRDALAARATTEDEARAIERELALREARTELLVRAARDPTDADLRRAFDAAYGTGGVRTRAQHVLVSLGHAREVLERARGAPPLSEQLIRETARIEAGSLAAKAREAGGLEALGPQPVPDGFERFAGDAFAATLRSLEPGTVSAPVESRFGFHLIEVLERTVTRYEDVAGEVRDSWMRAPPSLAEQRQLRERLYAKHRVLETLRRRAAR